MLQLIPRHQFDSLVKQHQTDYYVKYHTTWEHFIVLLYSQAKMKDSLRDIITSINSYQSQWYHVGIKDVKRSTISDTNTRIDYKVYEEIFYTSDT